MFSIIGIDPGTNTGLTIFHLDDEAFEIRSIESITINLDNAPEEILDNRRNRCRYLRRTIRNILEEYKPIYIAYETPFVNMRFPKSAIYLTEYTTSILSVVDEYDIKVVGYAPKEVKSEVGAKGTADKDDMRKCVSKIKEITQHIDIKDLTEHSIDSIAIAYVLYTDIKRYPLILLK